MLTICKAGEVISAISAISAGQLKKVCGITYLREIVNL